MEPFLSRFGPFSSLVRLDSEICLVASGAFGSPYDFCVPEREVGGLEFEREADGRDVDLDRIDAV